jgi:hypothetical protein
MDWHALVVALVILMGLEYNVRILLLRTPKFICK